MKLWLDDVREPWKHGCLGWEWAKTAQEAIMLLKTGRVTVASLDHDLSDEHYPFANVNPRDYKEQTRMAVVEFMEETGTWPVDGVSVHSINPVGRRRMELVIKKNYGRRFTFAQI